MTKNLIIVMLLAVLLTPSFSYAQTPVTNDQLHTLLLQLLDLYQKMLADLTKQLADLQAKQVEQSQILGSVQNSVTVVNTAPIVTAPSVTLGNLKCYEDKGDPNQKSAAQFDVIVSGNDWDYGQSIRVNKGQQGGGISFEKSSETNSYHFQIANNIGTTTVISTFGKVKPSKFNNYTFPTLYTSTNEIVIGDVCN